MSMNRCFGVLTFAGLGSLAADELSRCEPSGFRFCRLADHDLVLCDISAKGARRLPGLALAEDVFLMLGPGVQVKTAADLERLDGLVLSESVLEAVGLKNSLFHPRKPKSTTYNCFVKQDWDRQVRRKQIAERVNALLGSRFRRWRQADPASVELWGFYVDERLELGLRLSDEKMRYRGRDPSQRRGALRPTIAAALVYLADPGDGELVIDPMCGSGTILREAAALNSRATCMGGDIAGDAVATAAGSAAGKGIEVREWDATRLPLDPGTVDCFICNLPFGRQYSSEGRNKSLYPALMSNWAEKLKPGGRMVLLTADSGTLESALDASGLAWRTEHRAKVLGVWANIYAVTRH